MPKLVIPGISDEEFEKAGSKFATEGEHLSECGMPEWETPGTSIKFPFVIVGKGEDEGKESKIVCGVSKAALWKLKEMLTALGVPIEKNKDGTIAVDPVACTGKQFLSVWTLETDKRTPEEGGKGGTYTKPTSAKPVETPDIPF